MRDLRNSRKFSRFILSFLRFYLRRSSFSCRSISYIVSENTQSRSYSLSLRKSSSEVNFCWTSLQRREDGVSQSAMIYGKKLFVSLKNCLFASYFLLETITVDSSVFFWLLNFLFADSVEEILEEGFSALLVKRAEANVWAYLVDSLVELCFGGEVGLLEHSKVVFSCPLGFTVLIFSLLSFHSLDVLLKDTLLLADLFDEQPSAVILHCSLNLVPLRINSDFILSKHLKEVLHVKLLNKLKGER